MTFEFDKFSKLAEKNYPEELSYSLGECLEVFREYFEIYEERMGEPHPRLTGNHIRNIMSDMPMAQTDSDDALSLSPDEYPAIIAAYFDTEFENCDRNIHHFMSGAIRYYRWLEVNETEDLEPEEGGRYFVKMDLTHDFVGYNFTSFSRACEWMAKVHELFPDYELIMGTQGVSRDICS